MLSSTCRNGGWAVSNSFPTIAYNRYKRQPPKKRKEMKRIIDEILSLNETVGKENEEN